jgi:hypothetical protein
MIGRWNGLVIDCPDPRVLAPFYEELLGMRRLDDDPDWVSIGDSPDRPGVAFQRIGGYREPEWPEGSVPQQMHLDVRVDDLDTGEEQAVKLGARRLGGGGETFRVFADPAGHPFCLVRE